VEVERMKPQITQITLFFLFFLCVTSCNIVANFLVIFIVVSHDAAPSPGTNENQHNRFAQHIGSPRRGVILAIFL
jgi:hypothetical protein